MVTFHYEGGTHAGSRVVKVTEVAQTADGLVIKGKDVLKEEFRCYSSSKIRGDILVVG